MLGQLYYKVFHRQRRVLARLPSRVDTSTLELQLRHLDLEPALPHLEDTPGSPNVLVAGLLGWTAVGKLSLPKFQSGQPDILDVLLDVTVCRKDVAR